MLLILLGMSVNAAWGEEEVKIYFASLKAQKSPASTGDGLVKLTWLDICGRPMTVDLAKQINWAVNQETYDWTNQLSAYQGLMFMSKVNNWDSIAGARTYDGEAETAQLLGGTLIAIDGMEQYAEIGNGSQVYMTSFVYFHAETMPENGSYLSEWTFTDPAISRIDTAMGGDVKGGILGQSTGETTPKLSPCFKVLPNIINSSLYDKNNPTVMAAAFAKAKEVADTPNIIYAVFKKYLLSNPVATSASLEAVENAQAELAVTVEVNGDAASLDEADFGTIAFTNNGSSEWAYDLEMALASKEVVSDQKTRITIPVTYTYKNTGFGLKNTTMTISMAGVSPSSLNINLSVNALDPKRPAAFLLEGKDDENPESGTLSEILGTDISGYSDPIIKLNKPVDDDLTFAGKNFTLDLNGNETKAITVSSGNVTVAYSKFGGSATSLTVNGGKAILNGGTFGMLTIGANGTVEQNGATITGAATNAGSLTTTDGVINGGLTSSKTLVLNGGTFKGDTAVIVSGGTAAINRGAIEGTNCGLKVTAGTATVKKLAAIKGGTYSAQRIGGTLIVECGKFDGPLNGSVDFTSGYFKTNNYGVSTEGKNEMLVSAGVEYNEGYRYFLGTAESAVANGAGVCRIGNVSYAKLEDAIAYANNNPSVQNIVIFMTNNYTLPAGYYTLPANATIVVPMSDSQEKEVNMTAPRVVFNDQRTATPYVSIQPTEFRRLTFASGVNMDVFGHIELTCSQYASNEAYTSQPVGPYGHLVMEEGCHLTLQSGSEVRAWGFVTGKGEMDARRGATVREMFQLGDWKGAMTSVAITGLVKASENPTLCSVVISQGHVDDCDYSDKKIFPVTQYFIQNIESPVKYHPGSLLSTSAAVSEGLMGMSVSMAATDIGIIGVSRSNTDRDAAIFLMDEKADAENTWVRKWYDTENDIQVYDINSAAHIGSMVLDMGDVNLLQFGTVPIRLNSAKFDLPLTCNFKIHLLSGTMDFQQNTSLLPGAEVEVDKEATVTVAMDQTEKSAYDAWVAGGKSGDAPVSYTGALYVYDASEWDKYAYCNEWNGSKMVSGEAYTKTVRYAPSWEGKGTTPGKPDVRKEQTPPDDAKINVHGTFMTATGFVYTSESGANIFSNNEDAGTFIFNDDAVNAGTRNVYNVSGVQTYDTLTFYPARLKHGNGEYEDTDEAIADLAYCYQNDRWSTMIQDSCFMKENRGGIDIYYAKPQEYVALANGKTPNADHTYSDADGAGRLFIRMDNCQWWEVEKKDNLYHCIHPNNDTYYYWNLQHEAIVDEDGVLTDKYKAGWDEKRFTITWKNWDGTIIQTADAEGIPQDAYSVTYGTMAEFLGTNPTREKDADSTYNFTGWKPALGPVTQDVTYTATFQGQERKYTITFLNEGGTLIETQFLTHKAIPVCENTPTKVGHILQWSPAIGKVVADATYTATWLEVPPTKYEIRFLDYDGTLLKSDSVAVGETPEPPVFPSRKPATAENTYTCSSWDAEVVPVTEAVTYTAVYTPTPKVFSVKFITYNGSDKEDHYIIAPADYKYGETPVAPTKEQVLAAIARENTPNYTFNNDKYTYSFAWDPQIQTVLNAENNTYTATIDSVVNQYTVTLKSNLSGVCTFVGAGTYDYGKDDIRISVIYNKKKYTFNGWTGTSRADTTFILSALKGDSTLTANFEPKELNDKTVAKNETWDVPDNTEVKDLIITSDGSNASQLQNVANLTIRGEAIFRLEKDFAAQTWYSVAVPWTVALSGIRDKNGNAFAANSLYVLEFDANAYASADKENGRNDYWHFLDQSGHDMRPGKLYMIWFRNAQSVVEFHKKSGASLVTNNTSVALASGSNADQSNWNGIANPALYYASLSTGAEDGDVLKYNGNDSYIAGSTSNMIVGEPMFVQVSAPSTVYATPAGGASPAPYRRALQETTANNRFVVELTQAGQLNDRMIVQTAEEKANDYVIGKDLAKMGVSALNAQMWINRYDAKLCKNTVALQGEQVEYPLNISAPAAGEYILSASQERGNATLYLTRNGEAIWNLSESDYVLHLENGATAEYGLRLSAKAPQVATGIDEAVVDAQGETKKVLINNQVFIIRGEKVYTIDGQMVR